MSGNKNNYKNLNIEETEMNKINQIINTQNSKIERIQEFLTDIIDIYISYIKLSKEFSKKLETLAMKLKPDDKTFEGQIIQVFQSILLFNSNSLNEMIKDMNIFYEQENKNCNEINDINNFKNFKEVYLEQYRKTMETYKVYENGVENLENFLIKKELGLIKEENKNKENVKIVYNNQEKFVNNIEGCNELLKNLFDYFSNEKNKMRMQIFNYCNKFNDNVINYIKKQSETSLNQKLILDKLTNSYNLKELEQKEFTNQYLKLNPYPLKCLKLSEEKEKVKEKSNLSEKEKNKKLSIGQALHILEIFRNNGLILNQETQTKGKEESEKQEIANYLDGLFNMNNLVYEDSDKQRIISLLNDKINQIYFLKKLNAYRTKGKFLMKKNALQNLGYLFQYLNELITNNLDAKLFNLFLIMIFTFYYQYNDNETCLKYYLYKYFENNPNYKNRKLWENYLEGLITSDIKESSSTDINLNYIHFLNIMSVIKSMSDLHLGKDFINDFIEYASNKYKLKEDQKIQVNYILNDNEYGSFNENERSTLSTEINELNQSYSNSIDGINSNSINDNRFSNNSNRFSNNSNFIFTKNNDEDKKNESDGSIESIDVEAVSKK